MSSPRYKDIKLILETSQRQNKIQTRDVNKGCYVRGAAYYGGQDSE